MNKHKKENMIKIAFGFFAIATVFGLATSAIGACKQNFKLIASGVAGALLSEVGLGIAFKKYCKRELD